MENNPLNLGQIDPRLRDESNTNSFAQSQQLPHAEAHHQLHNLNTQVPASAPRLSGPSPTQLAQLQQYHQPIHDGDQSQIYMPQTPQSATHTQDDAHMLGDASVDPKRSRACEACRGLKVKCEPDMINFDGPCKRCTKANRQCIVTAPSRKRQKKADSRVAELEKRVEALTATLQATKSASTPTGHGAESSLEEQGQQYSARQNPYEQVTNGGFASPYSGPPESRMNSNDWSNYPKASQPDSQTLSAPPMVMAGQKRKHAESQDGNPADSFMTTNFMGQKTPDSTAPQASWNAQQKQTPSHEYADVVDRGLITSDIATKMFNCYVERMAPHMPAVVFPAGTTASEIRKTKPILFLAILSASSGTNFPSLQKQLTKEVMSLYADRIICNGEKTLELIQALLVSTLWYWPPEHFEELKFYQLIHIAAVMAIDIGMGKKGKSGRTDKMKSAGLWRDHPWRRTPYPDPETIEARRTWLGCYFLCCNASMGLRRPNLIRWSPFMAESVDVLQNSPDAAPTDNMLCQWALSQRIAEEVGISFSMDDPNASISISDHKVQYALKGFEQELDKWSKSIPPEVQTPSLTLTEHVINLYMHEVAMHVDHNVEEFKPPFTEAALHGPSETPDVLTAAHISALSCCLTSIDGIFETFLQFEVDVIRCLPVAHFVRVAYAVVVLIKMYFAAANPNGELGKVFIKDNMKVEHYLDGLVEVFRASAADERSRPAAKFLMVLIMLKTWFHRQREGKSTPTQNLEAGDPMKPTGDNSGEGANQADQNAQQMGSQRSGKPGYSPAPANTPLQLLSEVATGNSGGSRSDNQNQAQNQNQYAVSQNDWSAQQQQQPYPPTYDPSLNPMNAQMLQAYGDISGNIDPSLNMDLGFAMGDGFEQAMGITFGVGDIGNYFGEDIFGQFMGGNVPGFEGAL
ncbi:putative fungal specific transcription protein [Botrytis cinerea BcDW1]|uniref:Similar to transcription factor Cys6 n=2 Tax=Botryotinia fuckeliana TaxID=40559 RepID=G2YT46_BOTF4|nr:putative fungal specific transcription protein [Botrytis cinerea BcDW1]CCD54950.1 similar to transcription factor Cys6 [Botrytis cinerea T4]